MTGDDATKTVSWHEARPGDEVVRRIFTPDERQLFLFSAATQNPHRIHYDLPYARSEGYADLLVQGPLQRALVARCLMEWAGRRSRLRRLRLQHRSPAYVGQRILVVAVVNHSSFAEAGFEDRIELDVSTFADADRLLMRGETTLIRPADVTDRARF